eukprot:CAMPEP_0194757488 /NCGR_PEP_ID=MMETSP0323_2-20130528/10973_1 /TAXON_ID=2866 ORGANISM="Crypthecodinium cohnii, Strain Seligo" /NCGR_SAMPLE_ID=MMETSP0323_2 /ASSEMBLY_ACC=CAM_ASM_000346 /LENGTH=104 /DNA_ID=CAMNT_0039677451 /DNA_START=338 /DNA_END=653 /DNA_ORIENTATION=-
MATLLVSQTGPPVPPCLGSKLQGLPAPRGQRGRALGNRRRRLLQQRIEVCDTAGGGGGAAAAAAAAAAVGSGEGWEEGPDAAAASAVAGVGAGVRVEVEVEEGV